MPHESHRMVKAELAPFDLLPDETFQVFPNKPSEVSGPNLEICIFWVNVQRPI